MAHESKLIKKFWKPDGHTVNPENEAKLKAWMRSNGLSIRPGAITTLIHSPVHESARAFVAKSLIAKKSK